MSVVVRGVGTTGPLVRLADRPQATVRLLALPHGGGDATFFRSWANRLPAHVEVLAARYPGSRGRGAEPFATDLAALEPLCPLPLALFGHSMGAVAGYELALRLASAPLLLTVSGRAAPHRAGTGVPRDDDAVTATMRRLGAPDLARLPSAARGPALDLVRADLAAAGRYPGRTGAALRCPVHAFTGDADPAVTVPAMGGWRTVTTGAFTLTVLSGGHFALVAAEPEVTTAPTGAIDTAAESATVDATTPHLPTTPPRPAPPTSVPSRRGRATPAAETVASPCVDRLRTRLAAAPEATPGAALAAFWPDRAGNGTPVAEAENAPPQRFCWPRADLPRGRVTEYHPPAPSLGAAERRTWVYTPYGHRGDTDVPAVLVLLDGRMWVEELRVATTLDSLVACGALPPVVALLPDTGDRMREYACHPPFARFLCDDLLAWAVTTFGVPTDPRRTVVVGQSLGGLAATDAALRASQRFGTVPAESGSFWWTDDDRPERMARLLAGRPRLPLRFSLDAATDETDRPDATDRLAEMLRTKGYPVRMHRFSGGHDRACWMGELGDRLAELGPELGTEPAAAAGR